ncbi:hypothetical protein MBH78_01115 [Oceanimonas sp. NS1]|nr:hypothetical protein [Oceanimonas sp. NS1]
MKTTKITARYVIGFKDDGHHIYEHGELVYRGIPSSLWAMTIRARWTTLRTWVTPWSAPVSSIWMP